MLAGPCCWFFKEIKKNFFCLFYDYNKRFWLINFTKSSFFVMLHFYGFKIALCGKTLKMISKQTPKIYCCFKYWYILKNQNKNQNAFLKRRKLLTKINQTKFLFATLCLKVVDYCFCFWIISCSNDDDPADFSDENIQLGPICGLLIGRFGGFAPSERATMELFHIYFITLLFLGKTFIIEKAKYKKLFLRKKEAQIILHSWLQGQMVY